MSTHLTIQEFQVAMTKIVQNPSWKRAYAGGDILDLIYDKVNHVKFDQFKVLCERLLGSSRSAPLVPDFEKAVMEMGLRKFVAPTWTNTQNHTSSENLLYHLQGDVWADDNYIYLRGGKPSFIVKRDEKGRLVDNPYVQLDSNVRSEKLREVEKHLKNKTYGDYITQRTPAPSRGSNFRQINFEEFKEAN